MKKFLILTVLALLGAGASAQDVVHLWKYKYDNEELGAPARREKRVVLMGDSITEGWYTWAGKFFRDGRICRGISGEVTAQMLLRFRQDVIALKPKAVVILAGTNDIALNLGAYDEDYTLGNIISMVELARKNKIKVVLCSALPAAAFPWRQEIKDAPEKISRLNARLEEYARENKIPYVDYHSALLADDGISLDPAYSPDGVHPNAEGYKVMEKLLLPVLKKVRR